MVKTIYTKNIYRKKNPPQTTSIQAYFTTFFISKEKKEKEFRGDNKNFNSQLSFKHIDDKLKAVFKIPSPPILPFSDKTNVFGKEQNKTIPQSLYTSLFYNPHTH